MTTKHNRPQTTNELCEEAYKLASKTFWLAVLAVVLAIAGIYPHAGPSLSHITEGVANAASYLTHNTAP